MDDTVGVEGSGVGVIVGRFGVAGGATGSCRLIGLVATMGEGAAAPWLWVAADPKMLSSSNSTEANRVMPTTTPSVARMKRVMRRMMVLL